MNVCDLLIEGESDIHCYLKIFEVVGLVVDDRGVGGLTTSSLVLFKFRCTSRSVDAVTNSVVIFQNRK